jgi:hypothetical protein
MLFLEKKTDTGFEYQAEEFVGKFIFKSLTRIAPNVLDKCVLVLTPTQGGIGEIKNKDQIIYYDFVKNDLWLGDDEEESN